MQDGTSRTYHSASGAKPAQGTPFKGEGEEFSHPSRGRHCAIHRIQRNDAPDPIGCDAAALEVMPRARKVVSEEPQLFVRKSMATGSPQQLSKHYHPPQMGPGCGFTSQT